MHGRTVEYTEYLTNTLSKVNVKSELYYINPLLRIYYIYVVYKRYKMLKDIFI